MSLIDNYIQPDSLKGLQECLANMTEKSRILGGGTDILCQLREKYQELDCIVSLWSVPELRGIREEEGKLRIGSMATHTEIAENELVRRYFAALSMACGHVGSRQIRNKGTIGGSLANASPAGDIMPCIQLFHGEVEILEREGGRRMVSADQFLTPGGKSSLGGQEVILAVWLPIRPEIRSSFFKLGSRREVTIAQISMCVMAEPSGDGWNRVEAYLGAVDTRPLAIEEADRILGGGKIIGKEEKEELSALLSDKIRVIRENRKRPPKLKLLDCERVYKEGAVKSVVYDALALLEQEK